MACVNPAICVLFFSSRTFSSRRCGGVDGEQFDEQHERQREGKGREGEEASVERARQLETTRAKKSTFGVCRKCSRTREFGGDCRAVCSALQGEREWSKSFSAEVEKLSSKRKLMDKIGQYSVFARCFMLCDRNVGSLKLFCCVLLAIFKAFHRELQDETFTYKNQVTQFCCLILNISELCIL